MTEHCKKSNSVSIPFINVYVQYHALKKWPIVVIKPFKLPDCMYVVHTTGQTSACLTDL